MERAQIAKLAKAYNRAESTADELRPQLYASIYEYKLEHGDRRGWQTELVQDTGLTRERIRQIIAAEEKRRSSP
jgi:ribosomal protein L13E